MTANIKLEQQGGLVTHGAVSISRSMPGNLNGIDGVDKVSWNTICDDIEKALEPLNLTIQRVGVIMWIVMVLVIVILICSFVLPALPGITFIIAVAASIGTSLMAVMYIHQVKNQAIEDLKKLCEDKSLKYSAVSMKLSKRDEYPNCGRKRNVVRDATYMPYYIEVCVDTPVSVPDPDVEAATPETDTLDDVPVSSTVLNNSAISSQAATASVSKPEKSFDMEKYLKD